MDDGYLANEQLSGKTKQKGLCVVQRPEIVKTQERGFIDD